MEKEVKNPFVPLMMAICDGSGSCGFPLSYIDKEGFKICIHRWNVLMMDEEYKSLAKTHHSVGLTDMWSVSTAWIGIPYQGVMAFETMISKRGKDDYFVRYGRQQDARRGHGLIVRALFEHKDPLHYINNPPRKDDEAIARSIMKTFGDEAKPDIVAAILGISEKRLDEIMKEF